LSVFSAKSAAAASAADKRGYRVRMLACPLLAHGEDFFGDARLNFAAEIAGCDRCEVDRHRIPRRADAEAIDVATGEAFDHVRRRQPPRAAHLRPDRCRRPPSRSAADNCGAKTESHAEGERIGTTRLTVRHHAGKRARGDLGIDEIAVGRLDRSA